MAATRVDFYVLNTNLPGGRLKLTCRVVEKAYKQGNRVLIQTAGREQAMQLDELLWTFRAGSFIPHSLADSTANIASPVIIGTGGIKDVRCNTGAI